MLESSDAQKNCITKRCQDAARKQFYCCVGMIEINTIASGFGHLGPSSRRLQRQLPCFLFSVWEFIFFCKKNLWTSISSALPRIPIILHLSVCPLRGSLIKLCREKVTLITNSTCLNFSIFVFVLQTIGLGLMRSDYFNTAGNKILAVEFNTIASSFGGLSSQFQHFHR